MELNLAAVHTLSPEKFLSALELGGMPMPSVAVTRIEQADVVAWTVASGIVMSHVNGPDGAGGMPVSKVVADAEEEEQAILEHAAAAPEARVEELQEEQERAQEYAERVFRL